MKTFVTFILYYPRLILFFLIFKGFLISYVYASDLPPCPSKGPYHDCFGTYVWVTESKKGDKYVGEFKDNKMHGYGTLIRAPGTGFVFSGDKYIGQWKNGAKHGQGTYIWSDGDKYEGQWRGTRLGGVAEGNGIFTWKDGPVYTGQFSRKGPGENGKHGKGKIVFTDGRSFEGRWIDDLPSDGILTGRTGQRISLDYGWDRGKFRRGRVYKIKITFGTGATFIGEVDRWYNPTKGKFFDKSGNEVQPKDFLDFFSVSAFFK